MTLTRATLEAILVQRTGPLLTAAGMDGATMDGSNFSLNDPIGFAVRKLGLAVANIASLADSDLAAVAANDYDRLLDLAEYRTLESILGNLDDVNISVGSRSESLGQLSDQVEKKMERLAGRIEREYGMGVGSLSAGMIGLGFQEQVGECES
jgi:hypothetical protein